MKVAPAIRQIYDELFPPFQKLKANIDTLIQGKKEPGWHYISRLKEIQSFAQKLETGRFLEPKKPEDFLGCTIVVNNQNSIALAEDFVRSLFNVVERRPRVSGETPHRPSSFEFDELRLYCVLKEDPSRKPTGGEGFKFEIQLKTFLSHAWGVATHDLIYKGDSIDWTTNRIAYQVKAMLEHAEVSIATAKEIAKLPITKKEDNYTKDMREMIEWLHETWEAAHLPRDVVRLADTLLNLAKSFDHKPCELRKMVDTATATGAGAKLINLSPYAIVVKSILASADAETKLLKLATQTRNRSRILVTPELEIPKQKPEIEKLLLRIDSAPS